MISIFDCGIVLYACHRALRRPLKALRIFGSQQGQATKRCKKASNINQTLERSIHPRIQSHEGICSVSLTGGVSMLIWRMPSLLLLRKVEACWSDNRRYPHLESAEVISEEFHPVSFYYYKWSGSFALHTVTFFDYLSNDGLGFILLKIKRENTRMKTVTFNVSIIITC